jgi:hypothetical protein
VQDDAAALLTTDGPVNALSDDEEETVRSIDWDQTATRRVTLLDGVCQHNSSRLLSSETPTVPPRAKAHTPSNSAA